MEKEMKQEMKQENMCEKRSQVLQFLSGELPEEKNAEVEKHMEDCTQCSALLEGYIAGTQSVSIPKQSYQGEDKKLQEQVVHYEKGTRRILIFTLVGMIMGWFSRTYVTQEFFLIKLILCVPYKISEIIYRTLGDWQGRSNFTDYMFDYWKMDVDALLNFFPFSNVISALAEYLTPVLIGGFVYGSLAYFTGDKRIFTLVKYLKFGALWAVGIGLYVGAMFGAYHIHEDRLNELKGMEGFALETKWGGMQVKISREEWEAGGLAAETGEAATWQEAKKQMEAALWQMQETWQEPVELSEFTPDSQMTKQEITMKICFAQDRLPCRVNLEEGYLRTFGGNIYSLPKELTEVMARYVARGNVRENEEEVQ